MFDHGSPALVVPAAPIVTAEFRARYRVTEVGPGYRGRMHLALTTTGALAVLAIGVWMLDDVRGAEWVVPVVGFLFANSLEYTAHRGPMHRRTKRLATMFRRHAQLHHNFFTDKEMALDSSRDFKSVLFGPVMLMLFLGVFTLPIGTMLALVWSLDAAILFGITIVGYLVTYEWLHLAYHSPATSLLGRAPIVRRLRAHHQVHHDPRLMTRWNFNITLPVCDWLLGTAWKQDRDDR